MTWAEFQIRTFAFIRMEERKDLRAREIAWSALIGFHSDPKKIPKSKQKFWPIGTQQTTQVTESMKQAILRAQKEYLKKK